MIARKKRQKNDQFNYVVAKHDGRTIFIPTSPPQNSALFMSTI